ncbi:YbaB/EbfC family nucleoid-associated protein [Actinokineospora pegani]|uniref:YbaB/EbfC family nucleoid-associated protein n=1 Tax=Actinokineospora pegani TaxID=2654637 RepID=UPI0012EA0B5E|nr:YbaB/EbfC family nucleoid-associated protein [Actinokineospora pegani]
MDPAQWLAEYRERVGAAAKGARAAGERLRELEETATSPRGEVAVTVTAAGVLADVALTPAARRLEVDVLAALIVDTARAAQRTATARMTEVITDHLGDGPAVAAITQHAEVPR